MWLILSFLPPMLLFLLLFFFFWWVNLISFISFGSLETEKIWFLLNKVTANIKNKDKTLKVLPSTQGYLPSPLLFNVWPVQECKRWRCRRANLGWHRSGLSEADRTERETESATTLQKSSHLPYFCDPHRVQARLNHWEWLFKNVLKCHKNPPRNEVTTSASLSAKAVFKLVSLDLPLH